MVTKKNFTYRYMCDLTTSRSRSVTSRKVENLVKFVRAVEEEVAGSWGDEGVGRRSTASVSRD